MTEQIHHAGLEELRQAREGYARANHIDGIPYSEILHPRAIERNIGSAAVGAAVEVLDSIAEDVSVEEPTSPRDLYPEGFYKVPDEPAEKSPERRKEGAFDKYEKFSLEEQEPDSFLELKDKDGHAMSLYKTLAGKMELVREKDGEKVHQPIKMAGATLSPNGSSYADATKVLKGAYLTYSVPIHIKPGTPEAKEIPHPDSLSEAERQKYLDNETLVETEDGLNWQFFRPARPVIGLVESATLIAKDGARQVL